MILNTFVEPKILLTLTRDNFLDCCYYGTIFLAQMDNFKIDFLYELGQNKKNITFMRSLAKPLQNAIMADYDIIDDFKLKQREIAIFNGSHSGSNKHIVLLKNILKKHNINQSQLEIAPLEPLDTRGFNGRKTKLHNNCSAKHVMMILNCKYLGYEIKNYTNENHPIQKLIKKKQEELSEYKSDILTFDGCSTPLWGLTFESIIKAYFNLFREEKYDFILNNILKEPYYYGGFNRLDTEIIQLSKKRLFAKVGANGFVLVYNIQKKQILLVKLTQNNNPIRRLITLDILNKLRWLNYDVAQFEFNQKNQCVAKYNYKFQV